MWPRYVLPLEMRGETSQCVTDQASRGCSGREKLETWPSRGVMGERGRRGKRKERIKKKARSDGSRGWVKW
jgi:hypothetical protein